MKKIESYIKTSCGESVLVLYFYEKERIEVSLVPQGSRLLFYVCDFFVKIVDGKNILYIKRARDIFWRLSKLPIAGSRRDMVNELFENLITCILDGIKNQKNEF